MKKFWNMLFAVAIVSIILPSLALGLVGILTALIPSAFCVVVSLLAVRKQTPSFLKILTFTLVLVVTSFNFRLPGIISDLYYKATEGEQVKITRKLVIPRTEPIAVIIKNGEQIEYRTNPMSTYSFDIDLLVHGPGIGLPPTSNVNVRSYLLDKRFPINKDGNSKHTLIVDAQDNGFTITTDILVMEGGKETAHYKNRFRKAYLFENHGELAHYKEKYDLIPTIKKFTLALFQSTIWNEFLVAIINDKYKSNPIAEFIDNSIELDNNDPVPYETMVEAQVAPMDKFEEKSAVKDCYADYKTIHNRLLTCINGSEQEKGARVSMPFPETQYLIFESIDSERKVYFNNSYMNPNNEFFITMKVICTKNEVYAVVRKDLSRSKYKYSLLRYSIHGDLLGVYNFSLPDIKWRGKQVIVDFKTEDIANYEFTILDIDNKIVKGYRVTIDKGKYRGET